MTTKDAGTILIVDDQQKNIQVVGTTLSTFGYDFMVANSGQQAIERVTAKLPDLVLLDIVMPEMDGFAVCRAFREIEGMDNIPVIFLSADDDKNTIVRALEAGGVDYVTKPFNKAELLSRVRNHLELKKARDEAREEATRREAFVESVAHDLKNWIGSANFSGQLLEEGADLDSEKIQHLGKTIHESTGKALDFIQKFLDGVRNAQSEIEVTRQAVDLVEICLQEVKHFTHPAREKGIQIVTDWPETPVVVESDPEALRRVLDNLLSNAIKFSPRNSEVHISLESDPVTLSVSDEGPGFSDEDRKALFQPYTRLSAQPTNGEICTGLGLSIVKQLSDRMGLSLEVGTPPKGAQIRLGFSRKQRDT